MHVESFDIELFQEPPAVRTDAREASVSFGLDGHALAGQEEGWGHSEIPENAYPLHAETTRLESLVEVDEGVIGSGGTALTAAGKARVAVHTAEQGDRVARVTVFGVARHFEAELVVSNAAKTVDIAHGQEMIVVPGSADVGEGQEALLRKQCIEFEFPQLDVQPGGIEQVIETYPGVLEVESIALAHGRQHGKRDVFVKSAGRPDVQAREIKPVSCYSFFSGGRGRAGSVDADLGLALQVPLRGHAEGDWPVRGILINGRVAFVAELVAVIAELLSKHVQDGPANVAGGAWQAVFPGKRGNGMSGLAAHDEK